MKQIIATLNRILETGNISADAEDILIDCRNMCEYYHLQEMDDLAVYPLLEQIGDAICAGVSPQVEEKLRRLMDKLSEA